MANRPVDKDSDERSRRRKRVLLRRIRGKISIMSFLVSMILLVLAGKIFLINYNSGDQYSKVVLDHQKYTSSSIPYKRGQIVDRKGTILAYSDKVYNLILDPKVLLSDADFLEPTVKALTENFDLQRNEILDVLSAKPESHYERLRRNLTFEETEAFTKLMKDVKNNPDIKGVWFEDSYIRRYPFSTLACSVIGFSSAANGGEIGLENYYDQELSGTDGIIYGYIDENLNIAQTTKKPIDGSNLITTLDFSVQNVIEKHISEFYKSYGAKSVGILVMDPNSGGILGMAGNKVFDLNDPRNLSGLFTGQEIGDMTEEVYTNTLYEVWRNICISNIYEPGSTFKPYTIVSALEEGVVHESDTFTCTGSEEVGGHTIRCHQRSGHGTLTLEQSLMFSCNPAMMQIAAKMGTERTSKYQKIFGFGQKSGVDLPGEEAGLIIPQDVISLTDISTNGFGQNLNVNMVQMAAAFSSLVNGGYYYKPHVVQRIETGSGEIVSAADTSAVRQTITKSTSEMIKKYLKSTVDEGLAQKAKVEGYSIAGKTGTGQKYPRDAETYVISFIGCAPAENPEFVIYVVIDEPDESAGPSGTSTPAVNMANAVLKDLLPYMNVYKDSEDVLGDVSQSPEESYEEPPLTN